MLFLFMEMNWNLAKKALVCDGVGNSFTLILKPTVSSCLGRLAGAKSESQITE